MNNVELIARMENVINQLNDPQVLEKEVFFPLDNDLSSVDDSTKRVLIQLLGKAEEKVIQLGGPMKDWWLSEIFMRKGRCAKGVLDRSGEYPFWKSAFNHAQKAANQEVILQSSLELGFGFVEHTGSLREMLEMQMQCVRAICAKDVATTSRLRIIGVNLFDFWCQLEYRRLSEHDLTAKQFVIDSAKSLKSAGFDDDSASPIMILLISKVFDFNDPALEWARMETAILGLPVPEDVVRKINL